MNQQKTDRRNTPNDEQREVKQYKQKRNSRQVDDFLDDEDMDDELYDFCLRKLK